MRTWKWSWCGSEFGGCIITLDACSTSSFEACTFSACASSRALSHAAMKMFRTSARPSVISDDTSSQFFSSSKNASGSPIAWPLESKPTKRSSSTPFPFAFRT